MGPAPTTEVVHQTDHGRARDAITRHTLLVGVASPDSLRPVRHSDIGLRLCKGIS